MLVGFSVVRSRSLKIQIKSTSQFFAYCCYSDIDYRFYLKLRFDKLQFIVNYWWKVVAIGQYKITFKVIEKHRYGLRKTVSKHLKLTVFIVYRSLFFMSALYNINSKCIAFPYFMSLGLPIPYFPLFSYWHIIDIIRFFRYLTFS